MFSINKSNINTLFYYADKIKKVNSCQGKILMNAFFEPSTRTQYSFESAMYSLGGNVINFNVATSSSKKGESFKDTIKTLSSYADVMVLRHPEKNKINETRSYVDIPIINAGDGDNEHPTQALIDLYTMYSYFQKDITKINYILFVGDCKYSRTINSLVQLLNLYPHISIYFLPYSNCEPTKELLKNVDSSRVIILNNKNAVPFEKFDVLYCTRLQKERTDGTLSSDIVIDKSVVSQLKQTSIIMHPLPRNNEISADVDDDPRAVYFQQVKYGVKIRMALLDVIINKKID